MKIAILTSGLMPVPAVQGGAVENLIDFYLEYNDKHKLHDITVYSIWNPLAKDHPAIRSDVNHYSYIKVDGWWAKIKKKIYQKTHHEEFYSHHIGFFFEEAYKRLKKIGYDYIILENRPGYAYRLSARGYKNLVLHLHNDRLYKGKKYDTTLFNSFKKIITVSDYIKQRVETIGDSNKVVTIHNGIDIELFSTSVSNNDITRHRLGLTADDFVIVFSGRINKDKGVSELIDAMQKLNNHPQIKLLIIGSTFYGKESEENEFVKSLRNKAADIAERIIFTGFIPYSNMPHYLRLADIAALPSLWEEPFGLTIAEAQAVGLPIITTNCGGIPEVVSDTNAIILNIDDSFINDLASAILELYHNPEKRESMSQASLERSKLFDKDRYAKEFFEAIETI